MGVLLSVLVTYLFLNTYDDRLERGRWRKIRETIRISLSEQIIQLFLIATNELRYRDTITKKSIADGKNRFHGETIHSMSVVIRLLEKLEEDINFKTDQNTNLLKNLIIEIQNHWTYSRQIILPRILQSKANHSLIEALLSLDAKIYKSAVINNHALETKSRLENIQEILKDAIEVYTLNWA